MHESSYGEFAGHKARKKEIARYSKVLVGPFSVFQTFAICFSFHLLIVQIVMKRFLTAPFVGGLIGALEGGAVFSALLMMESRAGFVFGTAKDWLIPVLMMGLLCGVIFGAIIGFLVALLDATWSIGGSIGSIVGLVLGLALFVMTTQYDETIRLLAILVIPAGGSIGLLSAALTARRKVRPA